MKKVLVLLLSVVFIMSTAHAEGISFGEIPWLSDENTVMQSLSESGLLVMNTSTLPLSSDSGMIVMEDDTGLVFPGRLNGAEDVTFIANMTSLVKGKIAGCPVKNLILTFAYDGEYKLIAVRVEIINGNYDDLKSKLTKVYGEGEHKETEEGNWSTVWKGDDNSAVVLYTQSEGLDYTLMYGRLDAADILSQCLAAPDPDDVSGL